VIKKREGEEKVGRGKEGWKEGKERKDRFPEKRRNRRKMDMIVDKGGG